MTPAHSGGFDGTDVFNHPQNHPNGHLQRHAHRISASAALFYKRTYPVLGLTTVFARLTIFWLCFHTLSSFHRELSRFAQSRSYRKKLNSHLQPIYAKSDDFTKSDLNTFSKIPRS